MEKAKEFDVIVTNDGIEATVMEVYDTEPLYYVQRSDDNEMISLNSDQVKNIVYKASQ